MGNEVEDRYIPEYLEGKIVSKKLTVLSWKIWEPDRTDEPKKKVVKRRVTQLKRKKYKATKITNKLKVK